MIGPSLEKGIPVITDRFDASSYAYQVHAQSKGKLGKTFILINKVPGWLFSKINRNKFVPPKRKLSSQKAVA
jgi:hypothetical protein